MAGTERDDDGTTILRGVLRLGRRLRSERPPSKVSPSAIGLLSTLRRLGPMPAVRLAAEERLQAQSLSRLIASLEASGCIERKHNEADRREIVLSITKRGREILTADMNARRRWLEQAMSASLTKDERQTLAKAASIMLKLADC